MVQIGLNLGARHNRSFGLGWSFKGSPSEDIRLPHDSNAVAVSSMLWHLAQSCLPDKVIGPIEKELEDSRLPRMATLTVPEGIRFTS